MDTPIGKTFSRVKVTDAKHPLFNKEVQLLCITNKQYIGKCCVVILNENVIRHIPINSTSLGDDPSSKFRGSLTPDSVKDLLFAYKSILEVSGNGNNCGNTPCKNLENTE